MTETPEQKQLWAMLHDPDSGSFLDVEKTGEHYPISGVHTNGLHQLAPFCSISDRRRRITDIFVSEWRKKPLHSYLDVLLSVGTSGILLLHQMQSDPEFAGVKAMHLDRVEDPEARARLNVRRADIFKRDVDSRRTEYILGRGFEIHPDWRVGLVLGVVRTGNSVIAARDACADPTGRYIGKKAELPEANIVSAFVAVDCSWPGRYASLPVRMNTVTVVTALYDPLPVWERINCPYCQKGVPLAENELVRPYL